MARFEARSRGRWATLLLAGAVTQVVGVVALTGPAHAAPDMAPMSMTKPADARAMARSKLLQARAQLSQGNFDAAEALAQEVQKQGLTYTAREESPAKVLHDIGVGRTDPKLLLAAARSSLARKEFDPAEKFAKQAEKAGSLLTFPVWGDTPSAAMKDIAKARKAATKVASKPAPKQDAPKSSTTPPNLADGRPVPTVPPVPENRAKKDSDEARALIVKARAALTAKNLDEAKKLTVMARAKKPNLSFWEDNPDRLDSDIRRAEIKARPASKVVQTAATVPANEASKTTNAAPRTKEEARTLLAAGRRLLAAGKIDEASQAAQRIKAAVGLSWGLFEDSPDRLGIDIDKARAKRDRDESIKLTAEGRKAYEKADFETATRLAYRAQKLHGPYSIWDLGDQPNKLLSDIQAAQTKARKAPLPPAVARRDAKTSTPAAGSVAKATPAPAAPQPPKPAWTEIVTNTTPVVPPASTTPTVPPSNDTPVVQASNTMPGLPGTNSMPDLPGTNTMPAPTATPEKPAPDKLKAVQLVAEAQRLRKEGKSLIEAQAKAMEAQKIGATFNADEVSPDTVCQQIAVDIRNQIEGLVRQSYDTVVYGQGDLAGRYNDAEAKLSLARRMAQASGQDTQPIDQRLADVRRLRAGKAEPKTVVQAGNATPATAGSSVEEKMLEQARNELKRGELAPARRLAEQALNGSGRQPAVRVQAANLLRTIDAEEGNQKKLATERAFEAAMAAYRRREYDRSSAMIASLDLRLLSVEQQGRLREISLTPEMAAGASHARQGTTTGILPVRATDSATAAPGTLAMATPGDLPGATAPGRASASDRVDTTLLDQHKERQKILADKLRRNAIDVQREAADKFRAGQQDEAMEKLQDFLGILSTEQLDSAQLASIRRPIESRLSSYRLMKAQSELSAGRMASRIQGQDRVNASRKAEELKQKNVEKLMREFTEQLKGGHFVEAEGIASRVLEIDPDNTAAGAGVAIARAQRNVAASKALKGRKEAMFLDAANDADDPGPAGAIRTGVEYDKERWLRAKGRAPLSAIEQDRATRQEKSIERSMLTPINISFENTPLKTVLEELRDMHGINIVPDKPALDEAGVSMESPISMKLERISLKSALNLILHQVKLTYIIKDDVLQITTQQHAQGKQKRVTYPVADLIIPINNNPVGSSPVSKPGVPPPPTPYMGPYSMPPGMPVGSMSASSGSMSSGSSTSGGGGNSAGGMTTTKTRPTNTQEEQLIQLITRSIAPQTWGDMGGQATIEYHPLTLSLVVNQTTDIQEQIQDLLASLRRLQDQEVAVEVRFISVTEDFFERIGVNFNVDILSHNARSQPALLNNQFVNNPTNFINQFTPSNFLAGLTPAGTLTPGLDIPITNNSFLQAIPNFGGYASGGGLSLGLAFLSDIQVFLFMEAVQGDTRANVMQAPKLTMFNAQQATLSVSEDQNYLTGIALTNVPGTGQYAIVPQSQQFQNQQVFLQITPVISADRRFVRLNLQPSLTNIVPSTLTTVAPIAVPIFTANDTNLGAGQPILVTQYIQQPAFTTVTVSTTVVVPDGGTVVMGGLKRLAESRNEFGPPVLSKIPYLNRLFKNVGYGRTTESLLIMVTPRIIIQEEEETIQTGFSRQAAAVTP